MAVDPPDGIVIDSAGADHLHGGEAAMLAAILTRLAQAGISARAAVVLARHVARPVLVAPDGAAAAMLVAQPRATSPTRWPALARARGSGAIRSG